MTNFASIILAAGKGTRMKSSKAKVLFELGGKPLIHYPVQLASQTKSQKQVVVVGHEKDQVETAVSCLDVPNVVFAHQTEQLGTGHAVMTGLKKLGKFNGNVLILSGDVPLLTGGTINKLKRQLVSKNAQMAFVGFAPAHPGAYGRIIMNGKSPVQIKEYKDCDAAEKQIGVVNAGIYMFNATFLRKALKNLTTDNAQGEFYLTDLVEMAAQKSKVGLVMAAPLEVTGVNTRLDLANLERALSHQINEKLMLAGVTMIRPETIIVEPGCKVAADVTLHPGVQIQAGTRIATGAVVESGTIIHNSVIKKGALIKAYSVIEGAEVGMQAEVGPMGRLRPGTVLKEKAKVGNFVELKKTILGKGSKANHLSYLGDGVVGDNVNMGAGVIFCNYDGFLKHQTVIKDNVFVGSDSQIVAPATIGEGAYVASGSTVTADVPAGDLAISRGKQQNRANYGNILRRRLAAKKRSQLAAEKKPRQKPTKKPVKK